LPSPDVKLTRAEFHVLLALQHGSRHGYGVMQDVEELSLGRVRLGPGTLYTAIKRLVAAGLIVECEADAERRRCYRLTRKGRTVAADEAQQMSDLVRVARKRGLLPSPS
jgi:DNA-binding PadR family transcriptional regulator